MIFFRISRHNVYQIYTLFNMNFTNVVACLYDASLRVIYFLLNTKSFHGINGQIKQNSLLLKKYWERGFWLQSSQFWTPCDDCAIWNPPAKSLQTEGTRLSHFNWRKFEIFPDSFMFDRQGFELHLSDSLNKVCGTRSNVPLYEQLDWKSQGCPLYKLKEITSVLKACSK